MVVPRPLDKYRGFQLSQSFVGTLDEVAIFGRELTQSEITTLYETGPNDGIGDVCDNCVLTWNPTQTDTDGDDAGDDCDVLPGCDDRANLYLDDIINLLDFSVFASDYPCTSGCVGDTDGDDDTDIDDLENIAANWLCGTP